MDEDITKIKIYSCREGCTPIQIYQLSANGQDEYRALLKHLELFAEFLPYLTEAEKNAKIQDGQNEFQRVLTLENLITGLATGLLQPEPKG